MKHAAVEWSGKGKAGRSVRSERQGQEDSVHITHFSQVTIINPSMPREVVEEQGGSPRLQGLASPMILVMRGSRPLHRLRTPPSWTTVLTVDLSVMYSGLEYMKAFTRSNNSSSQ